MLYPMKIFVIPHSPMKMLLEPVYFMFEWETVKIPKGYAFDWASVPRFLSWIYPSNDSDTLQYWLEHDFLYSEVCTVWTRKQKDKHYVRNMRFIPKIISYVWIRLFGWLSYKKDSNYKEYKETIEVYKLNLWLWITESLKTNG